MPDISFWNKCNNRCVMCTNPLDYIKANPIGNYDVKTQIKKLSMYFNGIKDVYYSNRERNDYISITGGEPTIHPRFLLLIKYMSDRLKNIPITLLSNGRKFSNEEFAKNFSLLTDERFTVAISFHSYKKKTFEKITRVKNSFEETIKGIINLAKYFKGKIEIRTVIHRINIEELEGTMLFIRDLLIANKNWYFVVIHYEIDGISEINRDKIKLKLKESSEIIERINPQIFDMINLRLYHFPLCLLKPRLRKYAWITLPKEEVVFTKKCYECLLRRKCVGLMKRYYELYGDSELKKVS